MLKTKKTGLNRQQRTKGWVEVSKTIFGGGSGGELGVNIRKKMPVEGKKTINKGLKIHTTQ